MNKNKLQSTFDPNFFKLVSLETRNYPIESLNLDKNSIVIDVGDNVGGFVNSWKHKFNKFICIEASENNCKMLESNLSDIYSERILLINKAAYKDDNSTVKLMKYTHEDNKDTGIGNYGIVKFCYPNNHGWKDDEYELVETISLDYLYKQYKNIDLLKVDIEGGEFDFLFQKDLSKINYICIEIHNFLKFNGKQKLLIDWILNTHNEIYTSGDGNISHFMKLYKRI